MSLIAWGGGRKTARDAHLIFNTSTEFFVHGALLISFMNNSLPQRLIIYLFDF